MFLNFFVFSVVKISYLVSYFTSTRASLHSILFLELYSNRVVCLSFLAIFMSSKQEMFNVFLFFDFFQSMKSRSDLSCDIFFLPCDEEDQCLKLARV